MGIEEIKKLLHSNNEQIRSDFHVTDLGVFGSCVKGTMKKHSDIDLLVTFAPGRKDLFNYLRLKQYLENILGHEVDLVIKEALKPRLRDKILGEVQYVR